MPGTHRTPYTAQALLECPLSTLAGSNLPPPHDPFQPPSPPPPPFLGNDASIGQAHPGPFHGGKCGHGLQGNQARYAEHAIL